jgi:L-rhamnose mutarotase
MKRYGMVIKIKSDRLEEYKKLHAAVWPEVLAVIKDSHIRNYSIFFKDNTLFSYFEYAGEDFEKDMAYMAAQLITKKWWGLCAPCQEPLETRQEGEWWANMEEVFYFDGN